MKGAYSELVEHVDGRFGAVSTEVCTVKTELQSDIMTLDALLASLEDSSDTLLMSVNNCAERADTYFREKVALSHKVDRLEHWIHRLANKVGLKLEP